MADWDITGKTAFITGAARGIGAECARRLAANGMDVVLVGLEPAELAQVASECGSRAIAIEADVTDADAMREAADRAAEEFGGIDVVIANAGIGGGGPFHLTDPASFDRVIEVNLMGVVRTARATVPHLIKSRGYLLNVASVAAIVHSAGMASYAASKAGCEAFSDSLRQELAQHDVGVGVGYFSWIDTDLVRAADAHPGYAGIREKLPPAVRKTYPVSDVGIAVLDGIRGRRRTVVVPGWVRIALRLRGVLWRLTERDPAPQSAIDLERQFLADLEKRGVDEASRPVGAGGAAASH